jgi:fused signal recognition particle receptor
MFENLRNAFSNVAKSFSEKELAEKDINNILQQLEISLLESDVATEVIDSLKSDLTKKLIGTKVDKHEIESLVKKSLIDSISDLFDATEKINILEKIGAKKKLQEPYVILFVGINGTGKTTTLAKIAHLLQQAKLSVVVAAADTYRAGAIEQLKEHTSRLNLKIIAQNYGADPAAVAKDAVLHAKSQKIDCVLIDTAGRMQTSKNLMDQIAKITKVVNPDLKIFVGDSLAGNDTVNQAREFYQHTKFDGSILTKSDADARGGAALSIVKVTNTPILFVGIGQDYKDLKPFDKELFIEAVFGVKPESFRTETITPRIEQPVTKIEPTQPKIELPPQTQVKQEIKPAQTSEKTAEQKDPFEGIKTKDINNYVEQFGVTPPENDTQARELAAKIRTWIANGRLESENIQDDSSKLENNDIPKPKKKRSFFEKLRK